MAITTTSRIGGRARIALFAAVAAFIAGSVVALPAAPAQAITPACTSSSLAVTATFSQGAAGHSYAAVIFRNTGPVACTLRGFPGVAALNSTAHVIGHAGHASGYPVNTITVPVQGFASSLMSWMNFNPVTSGPCTWSHSIAVTPEGTTHSTTLPVSVSICSLQVRPTVAGTPYYPGYARAQLEWIRGSLSISAYHAYFWQQAINALHAGSATGWAPQISELHQLISLPDAMMTPTQHAEWLHDVHSLDAFFVTPGRYL